MSRIESEKTTSNHSRRLLVSSAMRRSNVRDGDDSVREVVSMREYEVRVGFLAAHTIRVEARSETEAREKALAFPWDAIGVEVLDEMDVDYVEEIEAEAGFA